jgi:hypothetical protein
VAHALRALLRVDGSYTGFPDLEYTTRLSFYAGRSDVRVEHVLRNSVPDNETHVKLETATLRVGSGDGTTVTATRSGSVEWSQVTGQSGLTFELIPQTIYGSISRDANGGMLLPDMSYHGATIVLEFGDDGGDSSPAAARSPLFARADGTWYAAHGAMSVQDFGTVAEERAMYNAWGWVGGSEPSDDPRPDYAVSWQNVAVHDDLESDDVWQNALMYLRTGDRGYWDRARAWTRYYEWEYTHRSDGFAYAWDGGFEGPQPVERPLVQPTLTAADADYLAADVEPGKICVRYRNNGADHMFGWGLADYYHLTGDRDAIAALRDLREIAERVHGWRSTNGSFAVATYGPRKGARHFLVATRLYELTGSTEDRSFADHMWTLWSVSPDWWEDGAGAGFHHHGGFSTDDEFGSGSYDSGVRLISTFQHGLLSHAYQRYADARGSSAALDRVRKMARWALTYGLHETEQYSGKRIAICTDLDGVPGCVTPDHPGLLASDGDVGHEMFDGWDEGQCDPFYTVSLIDVLVRGWRATGDQALLDRARTHWTRGSRHDFGCPWSAQAGPEGQVCHFVNDGFVGNHLYRQNGQLPYAALLLADGILAGDGTDPPDPTEPPDPPQNLQAE